MVCEASFRLYEELNEYLPPERRKVIFGLTLKDSTTIKSAILLLGVPPEEVDLVLVNGVSVPFNHVIAGGDMISIYPIFESLDISSVTKLRKKPLMKLAQDSKKSQP
jgi:hypothetical protein